MLNQNNNTPTSEDLKTDSIPDSPSEREATDDQENNESLLLPPKEDIVNDERKAIPKSNHKTYLKLPKDLPFATKKKPSPKTSPKPSKSKKEKKKSSGVFSGMYLTLSNTVAGQTAKHCNPPLVLILRQFNFVTILLFHICKAISLHTMQVPKEREVIAPTPS
jgi:hypothetical protein